ncbi:MAG: carboxymuconolactone decarboxylase family protein [Rhodanobacter sp.]|nr:MAG: carboxymuconolactone decarboxylase family protein [Rhodanobacter sp.]
MTDNARLSLSPVTLETAAPLAKAALEKAKASLGFIPNMYAGMANSPGLLQTYLDGYAAFRAHSGFTPAEQEVVFLTISRENGCDYCMAAHSMIAEKVSKVPADVLDALRSSASITDPRLAALSTFTSHLFTTRGRSAAASLKAFLDAGYTEAQVLEIVLALAVKTLSNYANHVNIPKVDDAFAAYAWSPAA